MTSKVLKAGAALTIVLLAPGVSAREPLTADQLAPALLADCDARTEPFGRLAAPIAAAATALIDLGVFGRRDFQAAQIGFCDLQGAGGPVAATSCGDGAILLDAKFAGADQALNLRATLAHEMTHHRQHRQAKARHGDTYCSSARYQADKPALEAEADAVGDKVAELFLLGRAVELVNGCDEALSVYLEADDPVAIRGAAPAFESVPAQSAAMSAERGLSRRFRFYAQTTPQDGPPKISGDRQGAQTRVVEGRQIRLTETLLPAPDRVDRPFRLRLTCTAGAR